MFYQIFIERNDGETGTEKDKDLEKAKSFAKQYLNKKSFIVGGVICDSENLSKFRIIKTSRDYKTTIGIYNEKHDEPFEYFGPEFERILDVDESEDVTNEIFDEVSKESNKKPTVL